MVGGIEGVGGDAAEELGWREWKRWDGGCGAEGEAAVAGLNYGGLSLREEAWVNAFHSGCGNFGFHGRFEFLLSICVFRLERHSRSGGSGPGVRIYSVSGVLSWSSGGFGFGRFLFGDFDAGVGDSA